ncbi:hypothetical protein [Bifidobacterium biavatii]|uniref:hypothetical protein n=1 Tax=Bifidobacterium biavatii TaxID=762212 RepID=UPI003B75B696
MALLGALIALSGRSVVGLTVMSAGTLSMALAAVVCCLPAVPTSVMRPSSGPSPPRLSWCCWFPSLFD